MFRGVSTRRAETRPRRWPDLRKRFVSEQVSSLRCGMARGSSGVWVLAACHRLLQCQTAGRAQAPRHPFASTRRSASMPGNACAVFRPCSMCRENRGSMSTARPRRRLSSRSSVAPRRSATNCERTRRNKHFDPVRQLVRFIDRAGVLISTRWVPRPLSFPAWNAKPRIPPTGLFLCLRVAADFVLPL